MKVVTAASDPTIQQDWPEPDLALLRCDHFRPPKLPITTFGPAWADWITITAEAAACPLDYVAAPLLATASALIGHARWAQASPGWTEPPHLWIGAVGDSGNGKSPGADCLMRDVLPEIERRMSADFAERVQDGRASLEYAGNWQSELTGRKKHSIQFPFSPFEFPSTGAQAPRLRQHDVTIEKVAELLANAAPKGLLIVRDELAGWIGGMNAYRGGGRAFWIEAYGGRPYRVERKTHPDPFIVPRLAVAVYGGTQPEVLTRLMRREDDGLLGRILWVSPQAVPFRLGHLAPQAEWAIRALNRLRELELQPGDPPMPIMVSLTAEGRSLIERFARHMQDRQKDASGLLRSAFGKARGQVLRLALALEFLWWSGRDDASPPPTRISPRAVTAAAHLMCGYFLPMAERIYGNITVMTEDRNAVILARWILSTHPKEVHIRHLQREIRLPGLHRAEQIRDAATELVAMGWLSPPTRNKHFGPRARLAYLPNPRLWPATA